MGRTKSSPFLFFAPNKVVADDFSDFIRGVKNLVHLEQVPYYSSCVIDGVGDSPDVVGVRGAFWSVYDFVVAFALARVGFDVDICSHVIRDDITF